MQNRRVLKRVFREILLRHPGLVPPELAPQHSEGRAGVRIGGIFFVECYRKGRLLWKDQAKNLVVDEGIDLMLDSFLNNGDSSVSLAPTFYIGLKGEGTALAGDTLASHSNWSEISAYTGDRKEWTKGLASSKTVVNAATVDFTVNADSQTIAGLILCTVASGTSGILITAGDFAANRVLNTDDVLKVTYQFQGADDGS